MTNPVDPSPATANVQQVMTAAAMNAIRDQITFLASPPHFKGVLGTGVAVAAATNIAWTATEDNYSGWDSTNHWWVVPAGCAGLYQAVAQFKWGSTTPTANQVIGLTGGAAGTTAIAHSPDPAAIIANGGNQFMDYIRVNAGDKIGVQSLNSGFTSSTDAVESFFFNFTFYSL